jgi:alkylation response protein AidB-like acyl-CoA dehydrogenase
MTQTLRRLESADIFANVDALLPEIRRRRAEIAAARCLPRDLVDDLKTAGVFRIATPREWGGPEMSMPDQLRLLERLAHADGSVGWCVMIGCDIGYYSSFLDDAAARTLWPDLDMVTAGWVLPAGTARRVDGGYLVDGRWSFGSGCTHADVIVGGCIVHDHDGNLEIGPDGQPVTRIIAAPAENFTIHDTWHTTGLAGSGSNDYSCQQLHVPAEHAFSFSDPVRRDGPLYRFPGSFTVKFHGTVLGLARRALDELIAIIETKTVMPQMIPMRELPRAQTELADAETQYRAARAYSYVAVEAMWNALCDGRMPNDDERADILMSRCHAARSARDVTQRAMQLAGTQAIFSSNPIDQLVRDAMTIAQHVAAGPMMTEAAGAILLGLPPSGPLAAII